MELTEYLTVLGRWRSLLVIAVLAGAGTAYGLSSMVPPTYLAVATLLVAGQQGPNLSPETESLASEQLANTYGRLITVRTVLERAREQGKFPMTVEELGREISVASPTGTQLLLVSARAPDPVLARDMTNLVANAFIESNISDRLGRSGDVTIVELAEAPPSPESPNLLRNSILGGFVALLGAAALALTREHLDTSLRSAEQIGQVTGLPILGQIPYQQGLESPSSPALPAGDATRSIRAEAYRDTRTSLVRVLRALGGAKTILVTSARPNEGKSTTVENLAVVFGLAGFRVVAVDANLRRPALHVLLGGSNSTGLSTALLAGHLQLPLPVQSTKHANVSLLASGPPVDHVSELLLTARVREILHQLEMEFDLTLVDTPPVLGVTDAAAISTAAGCSLIVVRQATSPAADVREAIRRIGWSGRPVVGVLLNGTGPKTGGHRFGRWGKAPSIFGGPNGGA